MQQSRSHMRDPTLRDRVPFLRDCSRCQQVVNDITSATATPGTDQREKVDEAVQEGETETGEIIFIG